MTKINYTKTLELIEKLMTNSHIRKYCTETCKGLCCGTCFKKNEQACYLQEGRRLPCSIYLCRNIYNIFPETDTKLLLRLNKIIKKQYEIYNEIQGIHPNIYFTKPDQNFIKTVKFPREIEYLISDIDIATIRNIMNKLIKNKIKIYSTRKNLMTYISKNTVFVKIG